MVRSPGFEPGSSAWQIDSNTIDWPAFEEWLLKDHGKHTVVSMVSYAQQYAHCLLKKDLTEVRDLRISLRPNVVKALSALAKFLGIYDDFNALKKSYGLKWTGRSADDLVIDRLTKVKDPGEVFEWIRQVKTERPELSTFLDFIAITGLRLAEALESFNLIIKLSSEGKLGEYYNEQRETLEHFRFKEIFIRKSKKAFISFVPAALVKEISCSSALRSKSSVQQLVRKRGLKLRFADVREAHASFMTKFLKAPEIDFIHGRVSSNVFMTNYYNPSLVADLQARVLQGIAEIQTKIS
jgi:intergrase/recombinase